jgi:predicted transcriptional regulator
MRDLDEPASAGFGFCFFENPLVFQTSCLYPGGDTASSSMVIKIMSRPPRDVTDAELSILQVLWDRGRATVRELCDLLYAKGPGSQHATVQKLLERLEAKDCVSRNRETWPHVYEAAVERQDLIGRQLQQTADKLCDGSLQPLLTHLVKTGRLSAEDRRSLRELLDELNTQNQRQGKK